MSEVCVGLAIAVLSVVRATDGNSVDMQFLAGYVTASLYLIVRGLDNLHQAWIAIEADPVVRRFRTDAI